MQSRVDLSWPDVYSRGQKIAAAVDAMFPGDVDLRAYPVPRGGIHAAMVVQVEMSQRKRPLSLVLVDDVKDADVIIDDIVDSGATRQRYDGCGPFFSLVDKSIDGSGWWTFPWERMSGEGGPQENVRRLLEFIGEDPNREGLKETPDRVVRSYAELFGGYAQDPASVVKVFEDGACDEMVIVRDVEFYSCCEHHMLPFFGRAHIAYIPNGKVIGVSKLVRLLEIYSRRLQIQERLCQQVTKAIEDFLQPKGSACVIEAQHFCMTSRGVQKQHSIMVTSSLNGVFKDSPTTRHEFLHMIGRG